MGEKSPEEELEEHLATLEPWLRRYLLGEEYQPGDLRAYLEGYPKKDQAAIARYEELLQKLPAKRREYRRRLLTKFRELLPPARSGRPRKDWEAQAALRKHEAGTPWREIGRQQGKTKEAARKLAKSRKPRPPGKNPH